MKQVIGGKLYNTDTAKSLGIYAAECFYGCEWSTEELYLKKNGEFFLHVKGHLLLKYIGSFEPCSVFDGAVIIPVSESEARRWAEKHLSGDDYIDIFGDVEE